MKVHQSAEHMLTTGKAQVKLWCTMNNIDPPELRVIPRAEWHVQACAYYRPTTTRICVEACARLGYAAQAWSWPGYVIDRTPYGVVAHELGHHVDWHRSDARGAYFGDFSARLRKASEEPKLTNYCPNDAEWFAEMFRLFVTNPDLLSKVRPRTYALFCDAGLVPLLTKSWRTVLAGAPARTIVQAQKKIEASR